MTKKTKICVIGGGSSYTPELIEGVLDFQVELDIGEISLMDLDAARLSIVGNLAQRMIHLRQAPIKLGLFQDLRQAITGADYVITQFRVGQMEARILDEKIPLQHGLIGQETTGAGGFSKALRTIPVMLEIAKQMEQDAPSGVLINFTNPSGLITEAVLKHSSIQCIGLCNIPYGVKMRMAHLLEVSPERIELDWVGLNHLNWLRGVSLDGQNIWDTVFQKNLEAADADPDRVFEREFLADLRLIPCSYLSYFYFSKRALEKQQASPTTRGEEVKKIETQLIQLYQDPKLKSKPKLLEKRGGAYYSTAAISLINALKNNKSEIHIVNTQNRGVFAELPGEAVIETACRIGADGAAPLPAVPLPDSVRGLVQLIKSYENLTIQASVYGDRSAAYHALLAHPLVGDAKKAKAVLEHLLQAHRKYLPKFFPGE